MKLRQMEVFHAVMLAGSVTGAAKILNISQPAVTNLLRHTEDQLRFKLFARVKGRIRPTAEAQALFKEVDGIFSSVRSVRRLTEDLKETRRGTLNIVTTPSLGVVAVPTAISLFLQRRDQVRVRLHVRQRIEAIEMVANGSADLGISFLSMSHASIRVEQMSTNELVCIMPRGHPLAELEVVSPRDIVRYNMISYSSAQGLSPLIEVAFTGQRLRSPATVEVSLISAAWALVSNGSGVAVVDSFSELETLFPNVAMRPFTPTIEVNLELLYPEGPQPSLLARSFATHLKKHFEKKSHQRELANSDQSHDVSATIPNHRNPSSSSR